MSERVTYTICCIGYRIGTSGKASPFFIWQYREGEWSDEERPVSWGKIKDAAPGVIYTVEGEPGTDGKPGPLYPATLKFLRYWEDHSKRRQWTAESEAIKLQDRASKLTTRMSNKATDILSDLNTTYHTLPNNQRAAFLAWVMVEVTKP